MNNQSPLVPQGSFLEQKNKGRARVKIAVFFVLAIHGIGLLALLMQGCRRDDGAAGTPPAPTNNVAQPVFEPSNVVADATLLGATQAVTAPLSATPPPPPAGAT